MSQPEQTSETATTHIEVVAAGSTQAQSLWSRAINSEELSSQRKTLEDIGFRADSQETASTVKSMMDEILKKKGKQWKVEFRGEEVVLQEVGTKILHWVDRFKQIGDIIVQYDPAHAALPWAGFRVLLQVSLNRRIYLNCLNNVLQMCLSKQENMDEILVGLEKTACLIDRCTVYEVLYTNGESAAPRNLEKSIIRLYTAILKFLAKAIKMLNGDRRKVFLSSAANSSSENCLEAAFTESISSYFNEVEQLEETVGHDASVAGAQWIIQPYGEKPPTRNADSM